MKKIVAGCALALMMAFSVSAFAADEGTATARDPINLLTGKVWQDSKPENKRAVLFGIDTAVAVEQAIDEKQPKKGKRSPHTLSVFEKSWMEAFRDTPREEIVKQVDEWYAANPGQLERPVMDVIWYEIITPRLNNAK